MKTVNDNRLLDNLKELAQIGATEEGGVSRVAFSEADLAGREWFKNLVKEAGFEYQIDGAGNQSAIFHGETPTKERILCGSHLDSVPNGGRYDGALGTLAAFEALQSLKEDGYTPPVSLEVINFTSEENVVYLMLGSRAVSGKLQAEDFERVNLPPLEFEDRLAAMGISKESILAAKRDDILAWVELHIEQATVLEESETDIGLVTSIVGIRNFKFTFEGQAAHAGTKPMAERQDALWGATEFATRARKMVMEKFTPGVMNIGSISISPGALNIVPDKAELELEFRHGAEEQLDEMEQALLALFEEVSAEFNLGNTRSSVPSVEPALMDERVVAALEAAGQECGLKTKRLLSFAGHDTQNMASICPSAMFFVPSVDGVSHAPQELTYDKDCVNGANLILNTLPKLVDEFAGNE